MTRRFAATATIALLISAAAFAGNASAAKRLGSNCIPVTALPGYATATPSIATADSAGVITRWGYSFPFGAGTYPQNLLLLSSTGANLWSVDLISEALATAPGGNSTDARIPIKAGQVIGNWGEFGPLACGSGIGTLAAVIQATLPTLGQTLNTTMSNGTSSIYADVEPDVDLDGFGDETQDACPQSAATQIACPTPVLGVSLITRAKRFQAWVTTSVPVNVLAAGTVRLPATKGKRARTLTFKSKQLRADAGKFTKLTLKYPRSLTAALAKLPSSKRLKLTVTVSALGIANTTSRKYTIRLAGGKR